MLQDAQKTMRRDTTAKEVHLHIYGNSNGAAGGMNIQIQLLRERKEPVQNKTTGKTIEINNNIYYI